MSADDKPQHKHNPLITALLGDIGIWKKRARNQKQRADGLEKELAELKKKLPPETDGAVEEIGDKKKHDISDF